MAIQNNNVKTPNSLVEFTTLCYGEQIHKQTQIIYINIYLRIWKLAELAKRTGRNQTIIFHLGKVFGFG